MLQRSEIERKSITLQSANDICNHAYGLWLQNQDYRSLQSSYGNNTNKGILTDEMVQDFIDTQLLEF